MNTFNIICGIVTIISFIFALILYLRDRSLRQHLEANLLSLIQGLDRISAMDDQGSFSKSHMAISAACLRDHAIGILRMFSAANHRLPTFDFGLNGKNAEDIDKERKDRLGFGRGGCIAKGQLINLPKDKSTLVEHLHVGLEVVGWNHPNNKPVNSIVTGIMSHVVPEVIYIDNELVLSSSQDVYISLKGYIPATDLQLGDQICRIDGTYRMIHSIEHKCEPTTVYAISTTSDNLFCCGVLVHNKK